MYLFAKHCAKIWCPEAFAGLVTAPVFKTGEASATMPGGFDSHPLPLKSLDQTEFAVSSNLVPTKIQTPFTGRPPFDLPGRRAEAQPGTAKRPELGLRFSSSRLRTRSRQEATGVHSVAGRRQLSAKRSRQGQLSAKRSRQGQLGAKRNPLAVGESF
jgi:hypothetical protein